MSSKEIPDSVIETVAKHISIRSSKNYGINPVGDEGNIETPQVFEITPFDEIDDIDRRFYAIDGSYNTQEFYNGLAIAVYAQAILVTLSSIYSKKSWERAIKRNTPYSHSLTSKECLLKMNRQEYLRTSVRTY